MAGLWALVIAAGTLAVPLGVTGPAGAADPSAAASTTVTTCNGTSPSVLTPGTLGSDACLQSPNGTYRLTMQSTSNLVLYNESNPNRPDPLWASQTDWGNDYDDATLTLAATGGMSIVGKGAFYGTPAQLWPPAATTTKGTPNPALVVQNDGNVVLYANASTPRAARSVWQTDTAQTAPRAVSTPVITTCERTSPSGLVNGQTLGSGGCLISPDHDYELIMQADGNLVLYYESEADARWAAFPGGPTPQSQPGDTAVLNAVGNLCVVGWCNDAKTTQARLTVQDDGNLVEYGGPSTAPTVAWQTATPAPEGSTMDEGQTLFSGQDLASPNGNITLVMQTDGNLVAEFKQDGSTAYWQTRTAGNNGAFLTMQTDGNLVLYRGGASTATANRVLWSLWTNGCPTCSRSQPQAGHHLSVQNDGNMVVYATNGKAIWQTKTPVSATTPNRGSTLQPGQRLNPGQYLQSPNAGYLFDNNSNTAATGIDGIAGRLDVMVAVPATTQACSMATYGTIAADSQEDYYDFYADTAYLELTPTGELVYHYTGDERPENGTDVSWEVGTHRGKLLVMQTDGNLVLYGAPPSPSAPAPVVWQSQTNVDRGSALCAGETLQDGQYLKATEHLSTPGTFTLQLTMQSPTGNLVLYTVTGGNHLAVWATMTNYGPHYTDYAVMQATGNFVLYQNSTNRTPIYATNSDQGATTDAWTFALGADTSENSKHITRNWELLIESPNATKYIWHADHGTSGSPQKKPTTKQLKRGLQTVIKLAKFILKLAA